MLGLPETIKLRQSMDDQLTEYRASKEDVASYEMSMCALIAEKNLPIKTVESIVAFNRRHHSKDPVLHKVQLGRTRATAIIKDGKGFKFGLLSLFHL